MEVIEHSPDVVLKWLQNNGITPIPCRPLSKMPIGEISEHGMDNTEGTFHEATPKRIQKINEVWANLPYYEDKYSGKLCIGADCNPGYNQNRFLAFIDIDKAELVSYFTEYFPSCPIIYGRKGVKLLFFLNKQHPIKSSNIISEGSPIGEFYCGAKRLCILYGQHERSTPDDMIWYSIDNQNYRIPEFNLEAFTEKFNECLNFKNYTLLKKNESLDKVYSPPDNTPKTIKKNPKARTIQEYCRLTMNDVINHGQFIQYCDELKGSPFHSSSSNSCFHVNLGKNNWKCWQCGSSGSVLEYLAISWGIIDCKDAHTGENVIMGDVKRRVVGQLIKRGYMTDQEWVDYKNAHSGR